MRGLAAFSSTSATDLAASTSKRPGKRLADGFVADTISTDIYNLNVNGPVYDMPTTMSKLMYLGMSFDDVLSRTTIAPAKIINRVEGTGTLKVGGPADVALLAIEEGSFPLTDSRRTPSTPSSASSVN